MKLLAMLSLPAVFCLPAWCQGERTALTADKLVRDSAGIRATGHARAIVGGLTLRADEATLLNETGRLEMSGHVHITLPAREDHTVIRYGSAVLLTDQPIGLTAGRATVHNGLLQAYGNIVVVPVDPELAQLRGDELAMFLRIADGTLRGNLRPSGNAGPPVRVPPRVFPPEIIK